MSGIRRDRSYQPNLGGGNLSRFPHFLGCQTHRGWHEQVSLDDRFAQGKHALAQNGVAIRSPLGLWLVAAMGELDGGF